MFPPDIIAAAELRATEIGTGADRVLVAQAAMSDEQYVKALAASLGTAYTSLQHLPRTAFPASDLELIRALKSGMLRLSAEHGGLLAIAPRKTVARHLTRDLRRRPDLSEKICLTTSSQLFEVVARHARTTIAQKAISDLTLARPDFSARASRSRLTILPLASGLATIAAFAAAPVLIATVVDIALALIFLGWTALRLLGALTAGLVWHRERPVEDRELPAYSIIVALYREAAVVEGLVESLKSLDYPPEKLDIILVLEPDDDETHRALSALPIGPAFTIITAPNEGPRTKPKALNIALPFARGRYVAVFDAEDRPEPDQLRKAVHAFQMGGERLACVQARLSIDNFEQTWLTRMFAAEYAGLFDVFLPGLAACRLPLPLGGSSNHFRTSVLRQAGAWDPYNVTEDADLGMRLARLGYYTTVIHSTTHEEAPSRFVPWLKQRTRWFKGWMQTWLVHMRHPLQLWRDFGPAGFLVFQLVIGGTVLAAMVHGTFAVALAWHIASGWLWAGKSSAGELLVTGLHAVTLVSGYTISGTLALIGLARRRMMSCARALLLMPLYWVLLSVAAWRALFHLILEPYAWEKTDHNLARIQLNSNQVSRTSPS